MSATESKSDLIRIDMTMENGKTYSTQVNGHCTDAELRQYFIDQNFNMGKGEDECEIKLRRAYNVWHFRF